MMDRRTMIGFVAGAAALPLLPRAGEAAAPRSFVMWRDPGCGCCLEWAKRIEAAYGHKLPIIDAPDMAAVKRAQRVPAALRSCHTALIHGLVVEGHVPPDDIKTMSETGWRHGIHGLAVAGMPAGSPGMDVGHQVRQRYQIMAFDDEGRTFLYANRG
jgi:hypothetical protein